MTAQTPRGPAVAARSGSRTFCVFNDRCPACGRSIPADKGCARVTVPAALPGDPAFVNMRAHSGCQQFIGTPAYGDVARFAAAAARAIDSGRRIEWNRRLNDNLEPDDGPEEACEATTEAAP